MGVVLGLSVAFAVIIAIPDAVAVSIIALFSIALPVLLLSGIIYREGSWRAFCIGGLFPALLFLFMLSLWFVFFGSPGINRNAPSYALFLSLAADIRMCAGGCWILVLLMGALTVVVRSFSVRQS